MRQRDPSAKALVFSQFTSTIEHLQRRLAQEGFHYRHISGQMTLSQRKASGRGVWYGCMVCVWVFIVRSR